MRTRYVMELESVRRNLAEMGETTVALFGEALRAVGEPNPAPAARASELKAQTDHQRRRIHDQCLNLITLQAPVARDARIVIGVLGASTDLELIADCAYEAVILSSSMRRRPSSHISTPISEVGAKIEEILKAAIDSWRQEDRTQALSVPLRESAIRAECGALYEELSQLMSAPGDARPYADLLIVSKHWKRILRNAVSIADQAADAAPLGPVRMDDTRVAAVGSRL